jgi:hypothetical protein
MLEELRRRGVPARGAVGDANPLIAAQDALREAPADEVVIFERAAERPRWFEDRLLERARAELPSPVRLVVVEGGGRPRTAFPVPAAAAAGEGGEIAESRNLPRFSPVDLGGMVVGVVGTIVTIVLAAAVSAGPGSESGRQAVAIMIAIGTALINMAHVVGLTLFESVHHRGGWEVFFHRLALFGTPLAVLANLAILLFAA